jgi:hypothetical protein
MNNELGMLSLTLRSHRDRVRQRWFACVVVSGRSRDGREPVNEPEGSTNLVALQKISIRSLMEVDKGFLRIGRPADEPVDREKDD